MYSLKFLRYVLSCLKNRSEVLKFASKNSLIDAKFKHFRKDSIGSDMNPQQSRDINATFANGKTELHFQALSGTNPKLIKLLVQAGANLEARTMTGKTPLILAAMNGNTEIITALLEAGANVWARDADGAIALTTAAWHNNMEAVRILLQASIYPRSELDKVLIHAVYKESLETIVALIKAGANTSVRTPDGTTLLMTAVKKANLEIITMLLKLGPHIIFREGETIPKYVGIDAQTKVGETALVFAVQTDSLLIVQKLIDAGADVNKQTSEGNTALLLAARSNLAIIYYLTLRRRLMFKTI
jgi:uncharacterized protein